VKSFYLKTKYLINRLCLLVIIWVCVAPSRIYGQENERANYIWFDQIIGETNSGIYRGTEYRELYRGDKEQHKFFLKPNFVAGQVVYDQQPFYAIDLLYDVFGDELLVRHIGINGSPIVQLLRSKVASFEIEGHQFVNLDLHMGQGVAISGFCEVLFTDKLFTVYKKHLKKILRKSDKESVYYSFKDKHAYYIQYNGNYHKLVSERDLLIIFPENKKDLQHIQDRHKEFRKSDPEFYLIAILKDLANVLSITKNLKEL
jgi:hypothetical protein